MLPGRRREARLTTLFMTHTECLFHDTGTGHPERPDRLRAVFHAGVVSSLFQVPEEQQY